MIQSQGLNKVVFNLCEEENKKNTIVFKPIRSISTIMFLAKFQLLAVAIIVMLPMLNK